MALDAAALIPVALVLIGGAISPGPSLAVVLGIAACRPCPGLLMILSEQRIR